MIETTLSVRSFAYLCPLPIYYMNHEKLYSITFNYTNDMPPIKL